MRRIAVLLVALAALVAFAAVTGSAATLGVTSSAIDTFAADQAAPTTTPPAGDTTPPTVVSREYFDTNADGKVDQIKVTYNEALGPYNGTAANWTVANAPAGMGTNPNTVVVSGSAVTLDWTTISTAQNTGPANLQLSLGSATAVRDASGNFAATFSTQAVVDKAAPVPVSLTFHDIDVDGFVDQIKATFSEALVGPSTASNLWTTSGGPPVAATPVSISGTLATVTLTEAATPDTAPALLLSLTANAAGVRDAGANQAAFTNRAVTDRAAVVLVDFRDSDTGGTSPDGLFEDDDWLELVFSEPILASTMPLSTNVTLVDPSGNDPETLDMSGLFAPTGLGSDGYILKNNNAVTYTGSTVTLRDAGRTIRIDLSTCSGDCGERAASSGSLTLTPTSSLTGVDELASVGSVTKTNYRMM